MNYMLSVIIPTKNRQKYCLEAIKQIKRLCINDLQIVIQDNSDSNELSHEIANFPQHSIKYNYHPGLLSFVDNFNQAVGLAEGKYLCMIGDDDCLLPSIIQAISIAEEEQCDAVIPALNSVYHWPSDKPIVRNAQNGFLCLSYIKPGYYAVDNKKALLQLMKTAGQDYQKLNLPRLYHGVVRRDIVQKVFQETGMYFDGLTPDIYISVALAIVSNKVFRLNYPVTVSGICPRSGSADSATGKHTGELRDAPHFRGHLNYCWDMKTPAIYSVESIWAETVLHALKNFNRYDLYQQFRVDVIDGRCLAKYRQFSKVIKEHAHSNKVPVWKLYLQKYKFEHIPFIIRCIKRIFRNPKRVRKFYDVTDISIAADLTMEKLMELMRDR